MKYTIIGKNIEITESIRQAIETKLSRMDKYFVINDDVECRAVARSYNVGAKVELTIFTKEMIFRAEVKNNDLYAAVDLAVDKLEGQMRKLKTRMDRRSNPMGLGASIAYEELLDEEEEDENDEVVRTKSVYLKPYTVEEAITKMEAIGHTFFLYIDADDNAVSVLYKRNDGGYGILQAENRFVK